MQPKFRKKQKHETRNDLIKKTHANPHNCVKVKGYGKASLDFKISCDVTSQKQ